MRYRQHSQELTTAVATYNKIKPAGPVNIPTGRANCTLGYEKGKRKGGEENALGFLEGGGSSWGWGWFTERNNPAYQC